MPTKKRRGAKSLPDLKFDLVKLVKRNYSGKEKVKRMIELVNDSTVAKSFAFAAVDTIVERTLKGNDKNDKSFKSYAPYSAAYKKTLKFRAFKGKTEKVNLKLTGGMLAAIDVTKSNGPSVQIGIKRADSVHSKKGHGHSNGVRKKGKLVLPQRDFWGLSTEEEDKIIKRTLKAAGADDLLAAAKLFEQSKLLLAGKLGEQELELDIFDAGFFLGG